MASKFSPINIGIAQLGNSFTSQNYFPYSAGLLQAYTSKYSVDPGRYKFLLPLYKRLPIDVCVDHLKEADIVGFSVYVWNFEASLEIARRLKKIDPDKLIIFGGPHVPDLARDFLEQYPFIDVTVHGEGESAFLQIVEAYPQRSWDNISGVSFLDGNDDFVNNPKGDRLKDITQIPSPFLEGTFAPLMDANPNENWIVLWETNRGCPFACTFCDWGSALQSRVFSMEMKRLEAEIDWFSEKKIEYVFCCDANFGILPRDVDIAKYVACNKERFGYPKLLSVQNTKNSTERSYLTQKILVDAGLAKGVNLAFQSLDSGTLEAIKRKNISLNSYEELQSRFTKDGVAAYSDIILGLPNETHETFLNGVSKLIKGGQHNRIQFANCHILPNAEMGEPEYQAKYGMKTVKSRTINSHGSLEEFGDGIYEIQEVVIATNSMPPKDWRQTRAFAWMTSLLHFDKLLQIPFIIINELAEVPYRNMVEFFLKVDSNRFPLIGEIRDFFMQRAQQMQEGEPEFIHSKEYMNIFWTADEYMFIKLSVEKSLDSFYVEANEILSSLAGKKLPQYLLDDAIQLNQKMLKQPFQNSNITVNLNHDIWSFYRSILIDEKKSIITNPTSYEIVCSKPSWDTWEDWMREVVWHGHKEANYLYSIDSFGNVPLDSSSTLSFTT